MPTVSVKAPAEGKLKLILENLKIKKIITVEDQRSTVALAEEIDSPLYFIAFCRSEPNCAKGFWEFEEIDFSGDFDPLEVEGIWGDLSRERRIEIWARIPESAKMGLFERTVAIEDEQLSEIEKDVPASRELKGFIERLGCVFREMSLPEWQSEEAAILASIQTEPALILFDLDLSKDGGTDKEGAYLLKKALQTPGVMCGLITHQAVIGEEESLLRSLSDEVGIPPEQMIVISKRHLSAQPPNLEQLANDMRMVAVSNGCKELRTAVTNILSVSFHETIGEIDSLSNNSFEQIIFTSSRAEGVWESDTLLRVFSILLGKRASRALRQNPDHREMIERIRNLNSLPKPTVDTADAKRIHAEELYESSDLLNSSHMPIDLGDVFKITIKETSRYYALLGQPCDLMIRADGTRSRDLDKFPLLLVRIRNLSPKTTNHSQFTHLPYFDWSGNSEYYAHFSEVIYVDPSILDLCSLNQDGFSKIDLLTPQDGLLVDSLKARAQKLVANFKKRLERMPKLNAIKGVGAEEISLLAFEGIGWGAKVPPVLSGQTISYPIQRIKRLNQPRAGDLLLRFAQHHSRSAFEHDLGRGVESHENRG